MIPINIIRKFFSLVAPNVNLDDLANLHDEVKNNSGLTPVQSIDFLLKRMSDEKWSVFHRSISSVGRELLPGLLFIGGGWSIITADDEGIKVEDETGSVKRFEDLEDVPVSIFVGLQNETKNI